MKKDNYRDYAAEAFRYYSLCGKPSLDALRRLRTAMPGSCWGGVSDLEAVCRLLRRLETEPDGDIIRSCLEHVYFAQPRTMPKRGAISERVRRASEELCVSESVIYRSLRRLRLMFALERGLRVDENVKELLEARQ